MNDTWENGNLDGSIVNVFTRIHKVLCLVVEGGGSNELVETKCGKKYKYEQMTLPDEDVAPPAAKGDITHEVDEDGDKELALQQNDPKVEVLFE